MNDDTPDTSARSEDGGTAEPVGLPAGSFDLPDSDPHSAGDAAGTDDARGRGLTSLRSGVAVMLVGALVLLVGMVSTTAASGGGNAACPDGTQLVAKFEFTNGKYAFEKPSGNKDIVVISDADAEAGIWTSNVPIAAIVVKGGPGSKTTTLEPPQNSGTFSNTGLPPVGRGNTPDISNIQFCGPTSPPPTTTTSTTSTTTAPYTAFVRITAICLDPQGYQFRVRHESGTAPVGYNLQIGSTVVYGPASISDAETQFVYLAPPRAGIEVVLLDGVTNQYTGTASTNDVPCTGPTTTTESTTTTSTTSTSTTSTSTTTTTTPTTTEAPTTTAVSPTTAVAPTSTVAPTTTAPSTTVAPTTTNPEVQGSVVVRTNVTPDDAAVGANGASRVLAYTGGSSTVMVVIGTVLLLGGAAIALVARSRERQATS